MTQLNWQYRKNWWIIILLFKNLDLFLKTGSAIAYFNDGPQLADETINWEPKE